MRKQPKQARSRKAVNELIDATAQVIAQRGLAQTTTNHIADRAGVSVGSLYQYFHDKDDLIEALLERLTGEIASALDDTLAQVGDADVQSVVQALLRTALAATNNQENLYLELARNWNQLHTLTVINMLEEHMMEACRRYILRHHGELKVDNLPAMLFVVINSTLFTVMRHQSLANPPISTQELIDALSTMIATYAERPALSRTDRGQKN